MKYQLSWGTYFFCRALWLDYLGSMSPKTDVRTKSESNKGIMQQRNHLGKTKNYVTLQNVYEQTWKYKKKFVKFLERKPLNDILNRTYMYSPSLNLCNTQLSSAFFLISYLTWTSLSFIWSEKVNFFYMILHFRFVQLIACGKNIRNINMYFFKLKDCSKSLPTNNTI